MQRISDLERRYVDEILDSQFSASAAGAMTARLERKFGEVFQSKFAISFVNGTATLHAALAAAGVGPGDEVIVPPLTMASTSFAALHAGAIPVFADVDPNTWTIDPKSIEERITPRTKAIVPVGIYGLSSDMDAIMDLARRHDLFVLDDAAQCFLGYYKERVVGTLAHASSFSFQSSKHMASGEGGMITTDDQELAVKIRRINSLGYGIVGAAAGESRISKEAIQEPTYLRHTSVGWNYRMPELCAAVALAQLERLQDFVDMRLQVANLFAQATDGCPWLVPQAVPEGYVHSYWTYVVKLHANDEITWYQFRDKHKEFGGDGIYGAWQLTYLEPAFRGIRFAPHQTQELGPGLCPVAESLQPKLLQFQSNYLDLDTAQQQADALAKTIRHFSQ